MGHSSDCRLCSCAIHLEDHFTLWKASRRADLAATPKDERNFCLLSSICPGRPTARPIRTVTRTLFIGLAPMDFPRLYGLRPILMGQQAVIAFDEFAALSNHNVMGCSFGLMSSTEDQCRTNLRQHAEHRHVKLVSDMPALTLHSSDHRNHSVLRSCIVSSPPLSPNARPASSLPTTLFRTSLPQVSLSSLTTHHSQVSDKGRRTFKCRMSSERATPLPDHRHPCNFPTSF
ncbi:hypothetical protein BU26DRAFT_13490 [Trematosphaeria pertusa]|uniref:Uncharacterized protein n=1 Tax=Trematosphaeria pertusa TaxID=390896 RepID=A0A6A6J3I6_9PLEO|nr:uncharacterized protein BU26DRAFT_13490 [Trematosphaeria pertusa]KAF2256043.1 hypothetical protein BU26DRAFT_13490 [Trematosphaeria pertusa]